jgi:hypothetical protein
VSDVAVPDRVSSADPSPQLTITEVTVPSGSIAVKVAVTICPMLAGFGETFVTVTVGGRSLTVSVILAEPGPALFVAVTVIVKIFDIEFPVEEYTCMSLVAVPGRLSTVDPSPQLTAMLVTVAVLETEKVKVTVAPVLAGLGDTLLIVTTGGLTCATVTVRECEIVPVLPELSVTVSIKVKLMVVAGA